MTAQFLCWGNCDCQRFEEDVDDVLLTDEVTKDPDSLEHVDTVETEQDPAVFSYVEKQRYEYFYVPVEAQYEEQSEEHWTDLSI